jgi:hypothetical protein
MDSYIIRIYRRDVDKPETMLGVLETVGDGAQRSFHSHDELWNLLAEAPSSRKNKRKTAKQRPAR